MKYSLQNTRSKFANDFAELSQVTIFLGLMTVKIRYSFVNWFPAFERAFFSPIFYF